jgi:archaemetzincin
MKYLLPAGLLVLLLVSFTGTPSRKVAIQPFDGFDPVLLDTVRRTIQEVVGYQVVVLKSTPMPQKAFVNIKYPRFRADSIIRFLKEKDDRRFDYVMGLTPQELSHTKKDARGQIKYPAMKYRDWGIHGLGYCPGRTSVVSTAKIQSDRPGVMSRRLKKICVHELGHNLGLPHCSTQHCVMQDSNEKMSTIDNARLAFCASCKRKLT